MEPRHIVRATAVAALGWVGVIAVSLVRGSTGPAPDPTDLLLQLILGPMALLAVGNGLAWLMERMRGSEARTEHALADPTHPLLPPGGEQAQRI